MMTRESFTQSDEWCSHGFHKTKIGWQLFVEGWPALPSDWLMRTGDGLDQVFLEAEIAPAD